MDWSIAVALVAVALLATAVYLRLPWQDQALESRRRRSVVVTLRTGETVEGVLWEWDVENVVLRQAEMLGQSSRAPVDGELLLRWADVRFVQLP